MLEDQHANEEDGKVKFTCTFCKAGGKLRWYKEKSEIFHGFKYHVESEGAVHTLVVNKLVPEDEGKYICKVNEVETFAYLTVTRKLFSPSHFVVVVLLLGNKMFSKSLKLPSPSLSS